MLKGIVFYTITSSIVYLIAEIAGASMGMAMLVSLVVPPVLLLLYGILRYAGIIN